MTTTEEQKVQENVFEQKAQHILTYLKSHLRYNPEFLPRPFFLEFTGSPSSGKTTTITELDHFLRHQGFRVYKPLEGAEAVRDIARNTPLYNIATCDYARDILIHESLGHKYDVVLFDRCIFDGYCWMDYWLSKGMLTEEEAQLYQQFVLSRFWVDKIDAAYFMICDPEIAIKRELRIALSKKLGETTGLKNLKILVERYKKAYQSLSPQYSQLHLIDTTEFDESSMVKLIAEKTLDMMEKKAQELQDGHVQ